MNPEDTRTKAQREASALASDAADKMKKIMELRSQSSRSVSATLERMEAHISGLSGRLRQSEEICEGLKQEREKLTEKLEETLKQSEADKGSHETEVTALKESISSLSGKVEAVEAEMATLKTEKAKSEEELSTANAKIAELEKSITDIQAECDSKIQKVLAAAERGKRAMKLEHGEAIDKLQAQVRDRNQKNNKLEAANKDLREENADLAALAENLQGMIDTLFESEMSNPLHHERGHDIGRNSLLLVNTGGAVREQVSQSSFREAGHVAPVAQLKTQS
jgi:chromosome segregation ATPase